MNYLKITENKELELIDEIPLSIKLYFWITNLTKCSWVKFLENIDDWVATQIMSEFNEQEKQFLVYYLNMRFEKDSINRKDLYKRVCCFYDLRKKQLTLKQYLGILKNKVNNQRVMKILDTAEIHYPDVYGIRKQIHIKLKRDIQSSNEGKIDNYVLEEFFKKSKYNGMDSLKDCLTLLNNEYFLKNFVFFNDDDFPGKKVESDFETFVVERLLDGDEWLYDNTLPIDIQLLLYVNGYISKEQVMDNVFELISVHKNMSKPLLGFYASNSFERYKKIHVFSISSKLKKEIDNNDISDIYKLEFWSRKNVIRGSKLDEEIVEILNSTKY